MSTAPGAQPTVEVVGDGTTARSRAAGRWRRARVPLVLLGIVVVGGLLALLPAPRQSTTPLAPDNPGDNGARAAAQILGRHGVDITFVHTAAEAERAAADGGTLLVAGDFYLTEDGARRIAAAPADLVLVGATSWLDVLAPGVAPGLGASQRATLDARCDDEDALAAERITATAPLVATDDGTVLCFPDEAGGAAYAVAGAVRVLADPLPLTNAALADEGNAALVLRLLGRSEHLVWYVPSSSDSTVGGAESGPSLTDVLPPWAPALGWLALFVVLVVALWQGRRLGPVVAERLPVVVPAAETTRGRGRLYRRSRSYGRAAAALRAGTATRLATRLGLPRSADAPATIAAVARASGRPGQDVARLLYGPPPTDEGSLAALAAELDHLENEVHRS